MVSVTESQIAQRTKLAAWLPLVVLPIAVGLFTYDWPPWLFMWTLTVSLYAGLKWLSFAGSGNTGDSTIGRSLVYLLLWPGMDAKSFFAFPQDVEHPLLREWLLAVSKMALGVFLVFAAVPFVEHDRMVAAWIGMTGIAFTLHFGLFHLLSVVWRRVNYDAPPIMNAPILATSLSDFWSKRWNLAFRDLAHTYVFRRFVGQLGIAGATMAVFFVSGVVHDVAISGPAGGGYGLPTLYFLIQGSSVLFERSRIGKRIGKGNGVIGRLFCAAVVLGPIGLLFHAPFVERVVVPMLTAIRHILR
jgi:alginate O-acetyltransferase complex protein AlgI